MSKMNSKAVTVQVGMILILLIVTLAVGLILANYRGIAEYMVTSSHETELRNSMMLLHANLEKVVFGDFPVRSTELKTYTGFVTVTYDSYMKVGNSTLTLGSIVFSDDTQNFKIVIENGAIFAVYSGKPVIVKRPKIVSSGKTKFIPAVQIIGGDSTAGKGVLRVRIENHGGGVFSTEENITVHSEYAGIWKEIFEENGFNVTQLNQTDILIENDGGILVKSAIIRVEFLR